METVHTQSDKIEELLNSTYCDMIPPGEAEHATYLATAPYTNNRAKQYVVGYDTVTTHGWLTVYIFCN
jgi:hypothetical protein